VYSTLTLFWQDNFSFSVQIDFKTMLFTNDDVLEQCYIQMMMI
jgi:hypothetical protein